MNSEEKRINDRFERIEADLETIAGYVLKHEQMLIELTQKISELTEAGKRTDDRLNIIIGIIERHFSNGSE